MRYTDEPSVYFTWFVIQWILVINRLKTLKKSQKPHNKILLIKSSKIADEQSGFTCWYMSRVHLILPSNMFYVINEPGNIHWKFILLCTCRKIPPWRIWKGRECYEWMRNKDCERWHWRVTVVGLGYWIYRKSSRGKWYAVIGSK